ncbi:hypothetical protein [Petrocella sp. FN5]|uniref:hypothetical protein n=1 Tax=Petrocella sp. FN5 TaxID=3032002 RepID=UPI0023DBECE7|nr:hypothetical protein [Petrocella sp. FN5]MDF1618668.1 hypothetical protein [Petrocella sp. FN5]
MPSRKVSMLKRIKKTIRCVKRLKVTKKIVKILIKVINIVLSGYEVYQKFFEKQIKQRKTSQI